MDEKCSTESVITSVRSRDVCHKGRYRGQSIHRVRRVRLVPGGAAGGGRAHRGRRRQIRGQHTQGFRHICRHYYILYSVYLYI